MEHEHDTAFEIGRQAKYAVKEDHVALVMFQQEGVPALLVQQQGWVEAWWYRIDWFSEGKRCGFGVLLCNYNPRCMVWCAVLLTNDSAQNNKDKSCLV